MRTENIGKLFIGAQAESAEKIVKKQSSFNGIEFYLFTVGGQHRYTKITAEQLKAEGITEHDAWTEAERNTKAQTEVQTMSEALGMPLDDNETLWVLSNKTGLGAGSLAVPDIIKNFAKAHHTKCVAMLPSSIYEVLLIPDADRFSEKELTATVQGVNADELPNEKERLGNRAYMIRF